MRNNKSTLHKNKTFQQTTTASTLHPSTPVPVFLIFRPNRFQILHSPAMSINTESSPPPPVIGKIGPYTVFMTPPSTPKPSSEPVTTLHSPNINNVNNHAKILPPPPQIHNPIPSSKTLSSDASSFVGFFKNAANKVQTAHSSLDEHLARWFGLNQSKYQWALDDYYETTGTAKGDVKVKEVSSKVQSV